MNERRQFLINVLPNSGGMGPGSLYSIKKRIKRMQAIRSMSEDEVNKEYKSQITAKIDNHQRQLNEHKETIEKLRSLIENIQ